MKNRALLLCAFSFIVSFFPVSLYAGKSFKKATIDQIIKHKKVARYWVKHTQYPKVSTFTKQAPLIDLIQDIIELKPKAHGFVEHSKRHRYDIICMEDLQIEDAQFVKLLVQERLFIIPAVGTIIDTPGGATYRLEKIERVKATLKNPEQISLILSVVR